MATYTYMSYSLHKVGTIFNLKQTTRTDVNVFLPRHKLSYVLFSYPHFRHYSKKTIFVTTLHARVLNCLKYSVSLNWHNLHCGR